MIVRGAQPVIVGRTAFGGCAALATFAHASSAAAVASTASARFASGGWSRRPPK